MANFRNGNSSQGLVGGAASVQDLMDIVEARISANENQIFDEEEAVVAGALLGPVGAMIAGLLAGTSSIENPHITQALEAQSEALADLGSAIESGDLTAMGQALDGLWGAGVPPDIEAKARAITMELANQIAEENYTETGVLGDGALGDNRLGDGVAYDYTLDLSPEHHEWANDVTINESGDSSPRPVGRDDNSGDGTSKPIILDLDGDGIEIEVLGHVSFDVDGDGFLEQTSWVSSDDAFLVIDLNSDGTRGDGDGLIDQSNEIGFSLWGADGDTDLQALRRAFDHNNDGILNDQDDVWEELRVWRDLDQDGITDVGELKQLAEWGISQINLGYDNGTDYDESHDDVVISGNTLSGSASFTMNGMVYEGGVGDVSLTYSSQGWRRVETSIGYAIEFENGEALNYAVQDGTGSTDINLDALVLDGVAGDDRANYLTAQGHSRSVQIAGGAGNDSVWGGNNSDMISGDAGADDIRGHGGDDKLFVDAADLTDGYVSGNAGVDTLIITGDVGVNVTLINHDVEAAYGSEGDDNLSGAGSWDDLPISGGGGDDTITGGNGSDRLSGDDGDDLVHGAGGSDVILGGAGADTLNGNDGDDLMLGGEGADVLGGGNGDDNLIGGAGDDNLHGGTHDDVLDGGTGADILNGGWGDDILRGGEGNDSLYFWHGDDQMSGGEGDDTFYMQSGALYGTSSHWGWAVAQGGAGNDTLVLNFDITGYFTDNIRHVGGNQWQLFLAATEVGGAKMVVDLQDIEQVQYADGRIVTLSTNGTLDTSDDYIRSNPGSRLGDGVQGGPNDFASGVYWGWSGNDSITAAVGVEQLHGGTGNDTLDASTGDDTVNGGTGTDQLFGGLGNDLVSGGSGADILVGGDGHDSLHGDQGADQLWGGAGSDLITGGSGSDLLSGGTGNDNLHGHDGNDNLFGGSGHDTLYGGTGSDRLNGNEGDDSINGQQGSDRITGGTGNDTILGEDGFDLLYGNEGDDSLEGGDDDDWLFGGTGSDTLNGGNGRDVLNGGAGADVLDGGLSILDVASYAGSDAAVTVDLGAGTASGGDAAGDTIVNVENLVGSDHADHLTGDDLDNIIEGGDGHDVIDGGAGHDAIDGGDQYDTITAGDGDDRVWGGNGRDVVSLGDGNDAFYDNTQSDEHGHDSVDGGAGNDEIFGGGGNDTSTGGDGNDSITGGFGNDSLSGGLGNDSLEGGNGDDIINTGTFNNSTDNWGNDTAYGGNGNDHITGSNGVDFLHGQAGNDTLNGGNDWQTADVDWLYGGIGDDLIQSGQSTVLATSQQNGDRLFGGAGNDTLEGGMADDIFEGGADSDTFVFNHEGGSDVIDDFEDNVDTIELGGFSFTSVTQALTFATEINGNVVFDFGEDGALTVLGTNTAALVDDIFVL
jgi:Ca2+-binding RTX toxin-like protein